MCMYAVYVSNGWGVGGICDTPFFGGSLEGAVTASHPRYPGNGDEAAGPDWTHVDVMT